MKRTPIFIREPIVFDKQYDCPYECPVGYVYKITNKITGNFYIGKHVYNKPYLDEDYWGSGSLHLQNAYNYWGLNNFIREILYWENESEEILYEMEDLYVDAFHAYDHPDNYNETPGGYGFSSGDDNIAKRDDIKKRNSDWHKGKHTGTDNHRSIAVSQFSLNGEHIQDFEFTSQVKKIGANPDGVTNCCVKKSKSSGGFLWCYKSEYDLNPNIGIELSRVYNSKWENMKGKSNPSYGKIGGKSKSSKKTVRLSLQGGFIKEYESCSMTSKDGFNPNKVANCCNRVNKSHKGFRFMFKSDYEKHDSEFWIQYWSDQIESENKHRNQYNFYSKI